MLALWLLKTNQREVKQRTEKGSYPSPFSTFRAVCIRESEVRSQKIIRVGVKRMSSGLYCGERACPPSGMACACPRISMPRGFQGGTTSSMRKDARPLRTTLRYFCVSPVFNPPISIASSSALLRLASSSHSSRWASRSS